MATKKTKKAPAGKQVKKAAAKKPVKKATVKKTVKKVTPKKVIKKKAIRVFPNLPISSSDNIIINDNAANWKIEMLPDANNIAQIRITNRTSGAVHNYGFATNNIMRIRLTGNLGPSPKLELETLSSLPTGLQPDLIQKGNHVPFFDIVKNNAAFPASNVIKIIGTDDDRNFDNAFTESTYTIANLQNTSTGSWINIKYVPASGGNEHYYIINATSSAIKVKAELPILVNKNNIKTDNQAA